MVIVLSVSCGCSVGGITCMLCIFQHGFYCDKNRHHSEMLLLILVWKGLAWGGWSALFYKCSSRCRLRSTKSCRMLTAWMKIMMTGLSRLTAQNSFHRQALLLSPPSPKALSMPLHHPRRTPSEEGIRQLPRYLWGVVAQWQRAGLMIGRLRVRRCLLPWQCGPGQSTFPTCALSRPRSELVPSRTVKACVWSVPMRLDVCRSCMLPRELRRSRNEQVWTRDNNCIE
jgi:hypothetical protein